MAADPKQPARSFYKPSGSAPNDPEEKPKLGEALSRTIEKIAPFLKKVFEGRKESSLFTKLSYPPFILILTLILILSMMPLVGWVGGLAGVVVIALLLIQKGVQRKSLDEYLTKRRERVIKLALWSVLFGVIAQGGCKIHSSKLVSQFQEDGRGQKAIIFNINRK